MPKVFFSKYREFKCLAADCPMNCCKVFRISFFKWEEEQFGCRKEWNDIDGNGGNIRDYLEKDESGWFCKSSDGACVFFDHSSSLCGLQLRHGEKALPSVCRTYPRIITRFHDRTEFGLDPCCPVVVKLMLDWNIGELETEGEWHPSDGDAIRRAGILSILADSNVTLEDCMARIRSEYGVIAACPSPEIVAAAADRSPAQFAATRNFLAFMMWSYLLPYDGVGIMQNMAALILDITACYLEHIGSQKSPLTDKWEISLDLSSFLLDYVIRTHFDVDIEGRYVDSKDV